MSFRQENYTLQMVVVMVSSFTYRLLYLTKAKAREILDSLQTAQINRSNESSEFVTRIEVLYN